MNRDKKIALLAPEINHMMMQSHLNCGPDGLSSTSLQTTGDMGYLTKTRVHMNGDDIIRSGTLPHKTVMKWLNMAIKDHGLDKNEAKFIKDCLMVSAKRFNKLWEMALNDKTNSTTESAESRGISSDTIDVIARRD